MRPPPDFWFWTGTVETKLMLAGALGGLVRTLTLRDNWREGIANVVVGTICGLYLSPMAVPMLEPTIGRLLPHDPAHLIGLSGFVTGVSAMAAVGFLIDVFKSRKPRQ